ncbi:MAG: hypothetical protein ACYTXT_37940 [Nostoc sp.]
MSVSCIGINSPLPRQNPYTILDFRFWIVKQPLDKCFSFPSVAIIFQIGITLPTVSLNKRAIRPSPKDAMQVKI